MVRLCLIHANRTHLRCVIANAHRLSPFIGPVDVGPVNREIAEEDHVPSLCGDRNGLYFVRMVFICRELGAGMVSCDVFEWAVLVAAGNDVKTSAIKGCIIKVNEAIDKIWTIVRVKRIVLMHRERGA